MASLLSLRASPSPLARDEVIENCHIVFTDEVCFCFLFGRRKHPHHEIDDGADRLGISFDCLSGDAFDQ
jgi:hypothetical protein